MENKNLINKDLEEQAKKMPFAIDFNYEEYFSYATSFIKRTGGTIDDAKEIFQEALLILLSKLNSYEHDKFSIDSNIKAYLYGIVRNLWIHASKEKKLITLIIDDPELDFDIADDNANIHSLLESIEPTKEYKKYMNLLDDRSRELFRLKLEEELSDREIAKEMGYSVEYVRQKRKRALQYLRRRINQLG